MKFHKISTDTSFEFEAGGSLESIDIAFHTSDREYKEGEKVVWICHALTANSDPTLWWPSLVGKGKLIDPDKYYVVCVNMLGSPYGSSGPASTNPKTGKPYFFDFPMVTVRDIVKSTIIVRKYLGIKKVDFLLGSSIGGFQAIEWAIMEPDVIKTALFMATTSRSSAYLTAYEEAQRMALEADPTFREAKSLKGGAEGLKCARAVALISYRYYDGYNLTQTDQDVDTLFAQRACTYQQYQGEKFIKRFDAYSYWYLAYSLDSHNIGRHRGGVEAALGMIKAKSTVISIDNDCVFPSKDVKIMAASIPGADFHEISSRYGHDGFLIETDQITALIEPLLNAI
ncbi:MAG: homoserine O-acetyltransferase [Bacteroidales bacterium]|nr:homoserine O-acetyltransferase [Bacteroidales bacterium]